MTNILPKQIKTCIKYLYENEWEKLSIQIAYQRDAKLIQPGVNVLYILHKTIATSSAMKDIAINYYSCCAVSS